MREYLERMLKANVEWLEEHKNSADLKEYAAVATATAQIVAQLGGQKETAVGAAVEIAIREIVNDEIKKHENEVMNNLLEMVRRYPDRLSELEHNAR